MQAQSRQTRKLFGGMIAIVLGLSTMPLVAQAADSRKPAPSSSTHASSATKSCTDYVLEAEQKLNIPKGMLLGIALAESGGSGEPRSFLLNVRGRTIASATERDAARHLRDPKGRLRDRVYAGCMQLSVHHHQSAFNPVEKIVNPSANVLYAAQYLKRLHREVGSWAGAVGRYNGGSRNQMQAYQCKVWQLVSQLDKGSARLMESSSCRPTEVAGIAPKTRRAFQQSQVASTE